MSSRLETVSQRIGTWFPVIVVAAGAVAVAAPDPFLTLEPAVPWLLALIMLGMGMTLRTEDFVLVVRRPVALVIGVAAHYAIMPLLGLGLALAFQLPPALAAGVVLVGAAPSGTASNVMVFLARGDTALAVSIATFSTVLAPVLTPLLVLGLAGRFLPVDTGGLFVSILQIVLVPVALGVLLRRFVPRAVDRAIGALPLVSVVGITLVVLAVVAGSAGTLLTSGFTIVVVVALHNLLGFGLGYGAARLAGLDEPARRAVSMEVGMQNSGLAAGLAAGQFGPAAALPAAIFSVWHNVSGSLLAGWWSRRPSVPAERVDA
ncbi:MAG: bile acid:sodium symporter family protein [Nocardioidaceae bacterium]|nr:bile acid:sodium symporter family protein [Nocardioidaceae bacterium]